LSNAPIGLAFWDRSLRYIRINEALATMYGAPAEKYIGHTLQEVIPDLAPTIEPILRRVYETGNPVINMEVSGETSAMPGQWRHWLASYFPVRSEDGQLLGIGAVVSEITDRKKAEGERDQLLVSEKEARRELQAAMDSLRRREEEFRLITNSVPVLISYLDPEQRFRFNNQACNDWFGQGRREVRGKPLKHVLGEQGYEVIRPHLADAMSGKETAFECWIPNKDNDARYMQVSYVPHQGKDGKIEGVISLMVDLTDRKLRSQSFETKSTDLEKQLMELTSETNRVRTELNQEAMDRKRFEEENIQLQSRFDELQKQFDTMKEELRKASETSGVE
jgi:PAS domain S-box-containing protein